MKFVVCASNENVTTTFSTVTHTNIFDYTNSVVKLHCFDILGQVRSFDFCNVFRSKTDFYEFQSSGSINIPNKLFRTLFE